MSQDSTGRPMTPERAERLCREALSQFGLDPLTPLELIKQRENTVFRARGTGGDHAVRLHRQGYHSDADIDGEVGFVELLRGGGVSVPRFLHPSGTRHFALVHEDGGGEHQIDVQDWLDDARPVGDSVEGLFGTAAVDPEQWVELGALAAESHAAIERAIARGERVDTGERIAWDADGLMGEQAAWGAPLRLAEIALEERQLLEAAIVELRRRLAAYGRPAHRYGPIHADFTVENVMHTPRGLVLIDFDDFAEGWHLFDLATMLFFYGPHPRFEELRAAVLSGYQRVRPLDDTDLAMLDPLIFGRSLTYLGWAADRRGEAEAEHIVEHVYPYVVRLAAELLNAPS